MQYKNLLLYQVAPLPSLEITLSVFKVKFPRPFSGHLYTHLGIF